jgi:hypothetical protein
MYPTRKGVLPPNVRECSASRPAQELWWLEVVPESDLLWAHAAADAGANVVAEAFSISLSFASHLIRIDRVFASVGGRGSEPNAPGVPAGEIELNCRNQRPTLVGCDRFRSQLPHFEIRLPSQARSLCIQCIHTESARKKRSRFSVG